jgi:AcrR family transcriptional regulator
MQRLKATQSPLNKHQQKTEITRRKFHKAALQIFSRDGFEASRIDDIASAAGYTRGAFYANYQSKEDLFFAILESESEKHLAQMQDSMAKCKNERERIKTLRDYYINKVYDPQWSILTLEFKLYALRHPKLRAALAEMHRSIRSKVHLNGVSVISCSTDSERVLRLALQAVLHGLVIETSYDPASLSSAETKKVLGTVFDALVTEHIGYDSGQAQPR